MKASQVYLRAAEKIDAGTESYSCVAAWRESAAAANAYADMFGFSGTESGDITNNDREIWVRIDNPTQFRVLALLLMSEIAKDSK